MAADEIIGAEMQKLDPATLFGHEYLTYVMWAITPEGRAKAFDSASITRTGKIGTIMGWSSRAAGAGGHQRGPGAAAWRVQVSISTL